MALIFSPVNLAVIEGPFRPRPRHAFLMLHAGPGRAERDIQLEQVVCTELEAHDFIPIRATDVGGTGDYLEKIISIIRGCGFGVAVFSEFTPAPTLANIFFEVGMCLVFGKPVVLAKSAEAKTPSDFTRTEWIAEDEDEAQFRESISNTLSNIQELVRFYMTVADVAMEADEVDYEMAFERYQQAVLIGSSEGALQQIRIIYDQLGNAGREEDLRVVRRRLRTAVGHFIKQFERN